jgi:hypothetical protein
MIVTTYDEICPISEQLLFSWTTLSGAAYRCRFPTSTGKATVSCAVLLSPKPSCGSGVGSRGHMRRK